MAQVRVPTPVKYFCALLIAPSITQSDVETVLEREFGPVTHRSPTLPFTQTTYYEDEMGTALMRSYIAFSPLRSMDKLAAAKHMTNKLEQQWVRSNDQRQVNLDPGYINLAKVVLATTKDYTHRLYIGSSMYAEITLRYQRKSFKPWEWTYPDYRQPAALSFFNQLREVYKADLRQVSAITKTL